MQITEFLAKMVADRIQVVVSLFNGKRHAYMIDREQNTVYGNVTSTH